MIHTNKRYDLWTLSRLFAAVVDQKQHIAQLPNAQLREAVFSIKWSLPQLSSTERVRHDPDFEPLAASLSAHYRSKDIAESERLPHMERLVPASLGHIGLSYQPIVRFLPTEPGSGVSILPHLQLGPGVFTVNQDGRKYEFDAFAKLVKDQLTAFRRVSESYRQGAIRPVQLGFALLNRFDLNNWDNWRQGQQLHRGSIVPTKASNFLREVLGFDVKTPYSEIEGTSIFRQELSQTFTLPADVGRLALTVRDASESPSKQVVTFDQVVTTGDGGEELAFDEDFVTSWLRNAHTYTKQVFMNLRTQHAELNRYLLQTTPHS